MTNENPFQCIECKHYIGREPGPVGYVHNCKAFKVIPDDILFGDFIHTKPFPGDNGILFEPIDGA